MSPFGRPLAVLTCVAVLAGCGPSADEVVLARSWVTYRVAFITPDGRVRRPEHGGDTVSEGQAYAMLRAAWMDDRATFDRVWQWSRAHLVRGGRPGSALMAWQWSPEAGVIDWNAASDADADAALALLTAARRWPDGAASYRLAAFAILGDLLQYAVVADDDGRLLFMPGVWADERPEGGIVLNPSYFAPASFRAFYAATGDSRWLQLADSAYDVLEAACRAPGGALAPDWMRWWSRDRWVPEASPRGLHGWDAVRVPWRVATDAAWFAEPRASAYLVRCVEPFVQHALQRGSGLAVEYDADLRPRGSDDHPLANALFSFGLRTPAERDRLLARVTAQMAGRDRDVYFGDPDRYYVNSLAYLPFLARAGRLHAP